MGRRQSIDNEFFRKKRPTYYAQYFLYRLNFHLEQRGTAQTESGENFVEKTVAMMRADPKFRISTWERRVQRAAKDRSSTDAMQLLLARAVCAACVETEREDLKDEPNMAWHLAICASWWAGGLLSNFEQWDVVAALKRRASMKAADKRHGENRAMKKEARDWYAARKDSMTKDAAAEALARKVLPVPFRTVREWLKDPAKKV